MNSSGNVDPLPYDLHTNRELEFMLNRGKPLAHFSDSYPSEADEEIVPELAFAPYVQSGRFVTREYVEPLPSPAPSAHPHVRGIRHVFYARSSEAWRIDAYVMMNAAAAMMGRPSEDGRSESMPLPLIGGKAKVRH